MDSTQFDALVRNLVGGASRRDITRLGLGALGTSALSAFGLHALVGETVAARGKKGKGKGAGKGKGKGKKRQHWRYGRPHAVRWLPGHYLSRGFPCRLLSD
jgi:hypothetical protein